MKLEKVDLPEGMNVFIGSIGLSNKLTTKGSKACESLEYNSKGEVVIGFKGKQAIFTVSGALVYPESNSTPEVVQSAHPQVSFAGTAQVETPQGHVHAGLGKGKGGVSRDVKG